MFGIIVDKNKIYSRFVYLDDNNVIQDDKLNEGEQLIIEDWKIANTMIKPKWIGESWIESASEDEIKAYREIFNLRWKTKYLN